MKHLLLLLFVSLSVFAASAQEAFVINQYDVKLHVTKDGVIEVTETIDLTFSEERHGIIRNIPYRFTANADATATRPFSISANEITTFITNIDVNDWAYEVTTSGDSKEIRIGSADAYVNGEQRYVIRYKVYNAINFFTDHSELYWNLTGNEWFTNIEKVIFEVTWDEALPQSYTPNYFVATGYYGATGKDATGELGPDRQSFSGQTTASLPQQEGVTIGISFPDQFLQQTPIPMEVVAEKLYFKDQEVDIRIQENGVSEITERYTIVPVVKMNKLTRYLQPYLENQSAGFTDWLGGQSRYVVTNVEVKKGKLCRSNTSKRLCFDLSDVAVGEAYTVEVTYQTYGNFAKKDQSQTLAFTSINQNITEPTIASKVNITLAGDNYGSTLFYATIQEQSGTLRPAQVRIAGNQYSATLDSVQPYLFPNEMIDFQLVIPDDYFTESVFRYDWQLFWLNNRLLFLPILVFFGLYQIWLRWGRDEDFSVMVQYYPPEDLPPSEAGILIDDKLHDRDLLALIPYWGANGFIEVTEIGKESIFKKDDYIFKMVKKLPDNAPGYERKMFNGIFGHKQPGAEVKLSSLKNEFYKVMDSSRKALEKEIKRKSLYMPYTRGAGTFMVVLGIILIVFGTIVFGIGLLGLESFLPRELGFGIIIMGILSVVFGRIMPKKAPTGLEQYKRLAGFELFVKDAELPRLELFMKDDPHYFDKTLPYAIVFDHVNAWSKKFEALTVQPPAPSWYHSTRYDMFSAALFTRSLNSAMRDMGNTFASQPSSSGSGGSSFGGGGFSGGGFGGGGGSSW